jgi:hypothetical protein
MLCGEIKQIEKLQAGIGDSFFFNILELKKIFLPQNDHSSKILSNKAKGFTLMAHVGLVHSL